MKCYIGLGSNLGERRLNLENAAQKVPGYKSCRAGPLVESPALVPEGAPESWRTPFLNSVVEIEWRQSPLELLHCLKKIEADMGRVPSPRWAPRLIDLDILNCDGQAVNDADFRVPHAEMWNRQFVLAPLKHLAPSLSLPGYPQSVLQRSRELPAPIPLWMGILNLTPDSFSDGGALASPARFAACLDAFDLENTQILDIGAESTRPGAVSVSASEEWSRLVPALELVFSKFRGRVLRPLISVDTFHAETAARALGLGVDLINDVSGLADPAMLELLKGSTCQYVLMHSLSVPADLDIKLEVEDPVAALKDWALKKLDVLNSAGIDLDRVIFDPGIGFGKSAEYSLKIVQGIDQFRDLPVRILAGHSRKSFLNLWGHRAAAERDFETLGVSLRLAEKGVDILRVHTPDLHQRAFRAYREAR